MTGDRDGAAVRIPPPFVFLGAVVLGVLLDVFVRPWPLGLPLLPRIAAALLPGVLGLVFMGGAVGLFRRTGQDPKPWVSTPEIISTGVYRFTRNPMYVGMALLQSAIGLGVGTWWILVLVPVSIVVVQATAVRHEEAYLEGKFGEEYMRYKSSVRRWI